MSEYRPRMTDAQIVKRAKRINALLGEIGRLISEIEVSDHPNAAPLADALWEHCHGVDSAEMHAHEHLIRPDNYLISNGHALHHKHSDMGKIKRAMGEK